MFGHVFFVSLALSLTSASDASEVHTRGWVEHARVMPNGLLMRAKLDSGARTTSIHAEILPANRAGDAMPHEEMADLLSVIESDMMEMLARDAPDDPPEGEVAPIFDTSMDDRMPESITFRLTSRGGKEIIVTEPVERWVSIRRRGGGSIIRPVVMMDLCIAGRRVKGEVNLADRSGFNYPLLIGRNMLRDAGISVDSRSIFASRKACPIIESDPSPEK